MEHEVSFISTNCQIQDWWMGSMNRLRFDDLFNSILVISGRYYGCLRSGLSCFNWLVTFAPDFQWCYFCELSCLFYLSFNFDFYVFKIMHMWARNLPREPKKLFVWGTKAELRARVGRPQTSWSPPPPVPPIRSNFIAGRPKAAPLFCLLLVVLFYYIFPVRFIVVVSIVSICLVSDSSTVATLTSIPAAPFAFWFCYLWLFVWWTKTESRAGLVLRKLL